jgi:hypothetical protein
VRRQEGSSEPLVGLGAGVIVKYVAHEADRIDGERRQHVVVPRDRVGDVAEGKLPFGQTEPGGGVFGPEGRKLNLTNGRRGAGRRWRRMLVIVFHDGNSGSPMSRLVSSKTVEMRLTIFPAT